MSTHSMPIVLTPSRRLFFKEGMCCHSLWLRVVTST
jgi:hypothetical protein